ncbi:MAG: FAD binding domain-containing protein, partial [Planctomycetota bacterium]
SIPMADLQPDPAKDWRSTSVLAPGEIVTAVRFDPAPNSGFVALKQKQSFDWPMVSGYAVLDLDGDVIRSARTCAGAVAPRPRLLPAVDAALAGVSITDDEAIRKACEASIEGAAPLPGTAYKKTLLPVAIRRAVMAAANPGGEA